MKMICMCAGIGKFFSNNMNFFQVNVNRKILRRKPDTILEIQQPVDPSKFNFTKIQKKEVLTKLQFLASKQVVSMHLPFCHI